MQWSTITREELYELVWSMPMTRASNQQGVSDVMLGRVCRERCVPRPPQGYWAPLLGEKKRSQFEKPPLPTRSIPDHTFHDFFPSAWAAISVNAPTKISKIQ